MYLLEEVDGTKLEAIFAGDHVKRFHLRYRIESEDENKEENADNKEN